MAATGRATGAVFTTPDPDEARAVQGMLADEGLAPETWIGPDPLTGTGDWMYGAAPVNFYNLDVPGGHADRARALLQEREGPARIPERADEPVVPPPATSRLSAHLFFAVWIGLTLAGVVGWLQDDLALGIVVALTLGSFFGVAALAIRWARRRAARSRDGYSSSIETLPPSHDTR